MAKQYQVGLLFGARPNFMKIAPIYREIVQNWPNLKPILINTGQHFDPEMSSNFLSVFDMPTPNYNLEVGSGTHAVQTANIMLKIEPLIDTLELDLLVVVGDVNSTIAGTLVAKKMNIPVAHVESGLRSGDYSMPEEINRLMTDAVSDLLLTPSEDADANLTKEGVPSSKIKLVGNVMIDSLEQVLPKAKAVGRFFNDDYGLVTLHRPSNVDDENILKRFVDIFIHLSKTLPLVLPLHPRTKNALSKNNLLQYLQNENSVHLMPPQGYVEFVNLMMNSKIVITDSGGLQEETTYLNVPCITVRENTERPVTITHGTNCLSDIDDLETLFKSKLARPSERGSCIKFWDGRAASRIVVEIDRFLSDGTF